MIETKELRKCFGKFATGVTVITYNSPEGPRGMTANSFTSVSLEPPLILVSVDRKTKASQYMTGNRFAVNILKKEQKELSNHFAGKTNPELSIPWVEGEYAPYLEGSLAVIECAPWREYDGGDHILFLGEVKRYTYGDGDALGFFCGRYFDVKKPEDI
ncbi:flavin reductase family protein [Geobacillus proteiniphilus]|uniref:Flavin reductase family protein n=1 Tax=Geobacillus proteiniphilus TaxID=860353 RepID=A0ABY9ME70_9BACL|nr:MULTISPECIES: flavin reductase family protein [Geobacillus]WMJ16255.1 flavin reductase family protein [Geobacillus proteiniphilus]